MATAESQCKTMLLQPAHHIRQPASGCTRMPPKAWHPGSECHNCIGKYSCPFGSRPRLWNRNMTPQRQTDGTVPIADTKKGRSMSGLLHNGISNQLSRRLPPNLRSLLKPPSRRSPLLLNGRSPWGRRSLLKGRSPRNGRSPRGGRLLVLPPAGTSV